MIRTLIRSAKSSQTVGRAVICTQAGSSWSPPPRPGSEWIT